MNDQNPAGDQERRRTRPAPTPPHYLRPDLERYLKEARDGDDSEVAQLLAEEVDSLRRQLGQRNREYGRASQTIGMQRAWLARADLNSRLMRDALRAGHHPNQLAAAKQIEELKAKLVELEGKRTITSTEEGTTVADVVGGETYDHQHRGDETNPNEGAAEGPLYVGEHVHEIDGVRERHQHGQDGWMVVIGR